MMPDGVTPDHGVACRMLCGKIRARCKRGLCHHCYRLAGIDPVGPEAQAMLPVESYGERVKRMRRWNNEEFE